MKIYQIIGLCLIVISCQPKQESLRKISIPQDFTVYVDEDSLSNINTFIRQHDKTMFALYNNDCSACLIGMSLWFRFAKEHPEITPVLVVHTEGRKKAFWIQTFIYYESPIYAIFDKNFELFLANHINKEHDTFIVDSCQNIITAGSISDKKFEKNYSLYLKKTDDSTITKAEKITVKNSYVN